MGISIILEKFFTRSSFYGIACCSILTKGPHVYVTIFSKGPVLMLFFSIVDPLCGCFSCYRGRFQ